MSGKMEMSLDDIIKQSKGNRQRTGGNNRRGGGKGGSPRRGPPSQNRKPGGGVQRGRSRGGITRSNNSSFGRSTMPSYKREAFLGSSGGGARRFGGSETTKLIVSNLDFGVTDSDILELFSEFGQLKSAGVHYDRSGRSLGSADLIFERRSDAIKAMKQYNGVPLDGREMNIQLATSEIPSANPTRQFDRSNFNNRVGNRGGPTNRRPGGRGGAGGNRTSNRGSQRGGKPGGGRQKKPAPPTAEELDAQLEEYVKSKVTSSEGA